MNLIPAINGTFTPLPGAFHVPDSLQLSPSLPSGAAQLLAGLRPSCHINDPAQVLYSTDSSLPAEGYRLRITPDRITVEAATSCGANYALVSLYHLLEHPAIPCGIIEDAPRYMHRGVSLDLCRHFFPYEELKRIVEQCALLKLNRCHLHLSDDEGFRMESLRFPRLNSIGSWWDDGALPRGGYYTQTQLRELVAFAAERNVTLIPEIDLPGHARAILASYPELGCLGRSLSVRRSGGIEDNLICAGKTGSLDFLCALLDEVCDIFPSPWIHIGGDEAHKTVWEQCPACRRALQTQGLTDFEQLQAQFMNRLISHLQQRGRTAICWNEAVCSGLLDSSAVVQYRNELDRRDYVYPQLTHGHSVIFPTSISATPTMAMAWYL